MALHARTPFLASPPLFPVLSGSAMPARAKSDVGLDAKPKEQLTAVVLADSFTQVLHARPERSLDVGLHFPRLRAAILLLSVKRRRASAHSR